MHRVAVEIRAEITALVDRRGRVVKDTYPTLAAIALGQIISE
jgi:hypothetical protein